MSDFKSRLLNEELELKDKTEKLDAFLQSENFNKIEDVQQLLLLIQFKAMETYLQCLNARIKKLQFIQRPEQNKENSTTMNDK